LKLTVAEYFSGIGLVRMGLEPHGWEVTFANDISAKKFELYKTFYPNASDHYLVKDIFKIDPSNVPITTLATCSFPCIDLSLAGNRQGINGKHSSAFWGFIKILEAQGDDAPPFVLVENVPGWLSSNNGDDFRLTVQSLNKLGYACDVFTLNALHFTPQSRPRIFIVGTKTENDRDATEKILKRSRYLMSEGLRRSILANKDLIWFYIRLPEPPPLKHGDLAEIVESIPESDDRWWSNEEVKRHLGMMDPSHRVRVQQLRKGERFEYRTFFRRRRAGNQRAEVRNDNIAGCLRTAVGGSGKQFLIRAGMGSIRMRTLTPREYARLQGVPERFQIIKNEVQALTGFGDAVCVPAIGWIAAHALKSLTISLSTVSAALQLG
jgi:DNA (cytosine-5)-methyltransferase 1